jgi:hypothetical protein
MTKSWAAVAKAINQRMIELDLTQFTLIERSRLSKAAVYEIQHNVVQRRRSPRTLEALSVALDWHPQHLAAVLERRPPPQVTDPIAPLDRDMTTHLAAIERWASQITDQSDHIDATRLDRIKAVKEWLIYLSAALSVAIAVHRPTKDTPGVSTLVWDHECCAPRSGGCAVTAATDDR